MLKRVGRNVSLGWLFFGAMLLDILLWSFVLVRVESVNVPKNLRNMADVTFDFPYSHGLAASLAWSIAMLVVGWVIWSRSSRRLVNALVLAAAVFSHFVLDWLVHGPELPVMGHGSRLLGFGLWRILPLAWGVEIALVGSGLWVFLKTQPLHGCRKVALIAGMTVVLIMTIRGQASSSAPPSIAAMAGTSLAFITLVVWFGWWVDRGHEKSRD
ncbi:MAG TPA: hypothetical protein PLX89_23115 [Verrucomicrobiota bacterium]|nr:hypothetical protein [Verrucomicrobiales bacterium]HRI15899.1 hypothetical protein [Verrucomicrobiota bacterium]